MADVAVIPVYEHEHAVGTVVDAVLAHDLPVILVDDGSGPSCAAVLDALAARRPDRTFLVRLPQNGGKGAAVTAGLREAERRGYTHALQIDADGQHDTADIPRFLALSRADRDAVVAGCPVFDATAPKARLYGRRISQVWVWINTLSRAVDDPMCGFRVYPVGPACRLLGEEPVGRGMDFDLEVLVRLVWRGTRIVNASTAVRYPLDGVSHFRMWADNVAISRMHARLFFGMLARLPRLLWRRARS